MKNKITLLALLFVLFHASFVWADDNCEASRGIVPICGFRGPEDIVHVPETPFLIVGQYGGVVNRGSGNLVLFNTNTQEIKTLFPGAGAGRLPNRLWGQEECVIPPQHFSPHGIDLVQRPNGDLILLVVNHSELDSVQFFHVLQDKQGLSLQWQGCVFMPNNIDLNDVVALPQGGFVTTAAKVTKKEPLKIQPGMHVLRWDPGTGLSTLLERETGYANGIAVTPDGSTLFINDTVGGRGVMKVSLSDGKILAKADIKMPDNSSWGSDGNLLVMSILISSFKEQLPVCENNKNGHCPIPFSISTLDPASMQTRILFEHDGQEVFGGGTVAVQVGDALYLGCGFGNRMAKVKAPSL